MLEPVGLEKEQESYHELFQMKTPLPSLSEEKRARSGSTTLSGNVKCAACPDWMRSSVARGGQGWHSHAAVRSSLFARRMTGEGDGGRPCQWCQAAPTVSTRSAATLTSNFTLFNFMNHFTGTATTDVDSAQKCAPVLIHLQ